MSSNTLLTISTEDHNKNSEVELIFKDVDKEDGYISLVRYINKHSVLVDWMEKITKELKIINLVTEDWKSVLKNNLRFQEHMNLKVDYGLGQNQQKTENNAVRINLHYIKKSDHYLHVLLAGDFKLKIKTNSTVLRHVDSAPLKCISQVMALKFKHYNLYDNSDYFVHSCKGQCSYCKKNEISSENDWCTLSTLVYNNGKLDSAERRYCETLYKSVTKAIVNLEISSLYSFGEEKVTNSIEKRQTEGSVEENTAKRMKTTDDNFIPLENETTSQKMERNISEISAEDTMKSNYVFATPKNMNIESCTPQILMQRVSNLVKIIREWAYEIFRIETSNTDILIDQTNCSLKKLKTWGKQFLGIELFTSENLEKISINNTDDLIKTWSMKHFNIEPQKLIDLIKQKLRKTTSNFSSIEDFSIEKLYDNIETITGEYMKLKEWALNSLNIETLTVDNLMEYIEAQEKCIAQRVMTNFNQQKCTPEQLKDSESIKLNYEAIISWAREFIHVQPFHAENLITHVNTLNKNYEEIKSYAKKTFNIQDFTPNLFFQAIEKDVQKIDTWFQKHFGFSLRHSDALLEADKRLAIMQSDDKIKRWARIALGTDDSDMLLNDLMETINQRKILQSFVKDTLNIEYLSFENTIKELKELVQKYSNLTVWFEKMKTWWMRNFSNELSLENMEEQMLEISAYDQQNKLSITEIEEDENRITILKKQVEDCEIRNETCLKQNETLTKLKNEEIQRLTQKIVHYEKELQSLTDKMSNYKETLTEEVKNHQTTITKQKDYIEKLKNENQGFKEIIDEQKRAIDDFTVTLNTQSVTVLDLQNKEISRKKSKISTKMELDKTITTLEKGNETVYESSSSPNKRKKRKFEYEFSDPKYEQEEIVDFDDSLKDLWQKREVNHNINLLRLQKLLEDLETANDHVAILTAYVQNQIDILNNYEKKVNTNSSINDLLIYTKNETEQFIKKLTVKDEVNKVFHTYFDSVDGFLGFMFNDITNYVDNLSIEDDNSPHSNTIRKMYNFDHVKILSGSDAAATIFLAVLCTYIKYFPNEKCLVVSKKDVEMYLLKNSQSYPDIKSVILSELIDFYQSNTVNLHNIARVKIIQLNNRLFKSV
ncbi:centromere-associated protein E-like [Uloborus diversus]|uniref:centromere-associated protein E-like n=1 Tax=Uloborus diversus TaxID=327109 RepID=UPI0024096866|nr:centromere-associated protein E-like [Uloborus diversus]